MGTVVEATHRALGKRVAIKRFHPHLAAKPESLARFVREGRAVARLRHPHIVEVFDLEQPEEVPPYLVMELLEGTTLAEHLPRAAQLDPRDAIALILPLASALRAAHLAGVVHRDVKPSNIFLRGGLLTDPCLVDFGVSKNAECVGIDELTETGTLVGSYPYFSPEHTRGARHVTAQSDLYSLAAVLYECITGAPPFDGESAYELMHTIATQDVKPPSVLRAGLPRELDEVLLRAMDRDPARRYPDMRAFGSALLGYADKRTWHVWSKDFVAGASERRSLERTADESISPPLATARLIVRPARLLAPLLAFGLLTVAAFVILHGRSGSAGRATVMETPALADTSAAVETPLAVSAARAEAAPSVAADSEPPRPTPPPIVLKPVRPPGGNTGHPRKNDATALPQAERGSNGVPIFD
jgi:serine/threonine protein kinase